VRADFRRRGLGRELFYLVRGELEQDGCRILKSEVQPDEPGRMSFWEELGFSVVKVQMALNLAADEEE
jgi:ribosomal protein S18 acetylase RimI-like enzyme